MPQFGSLDTASGADGRRIYDNGAHDDAREVLLAGNETTIVGGDYQGTFR